MQQTTLFFFWPRSVSVCEWVKLFVTDKLGAVTVYPAYDTYSEPALSWECTDTYFILIISTTIAWRQTCTCSRDLDTRIWPKNQQSTTDDLADVI